MLWQLWGSGGICWSILKLNTRTKWAVSFTTRPLYPPGKRPPAIYLTKTRACLDGVEKKWCVDTAGNKTPIPRTSSINQSLYQLKWTGCYWWLTFQRLNFFTVLYKNSVRTSQETHDVSTAKPNWLILFGERVAVYCENHTEHTDKLCGQNAEFVPHRKHITSPLQCPVG
jgi:hypothetical protein